MESGLYVYLLSQLRINTAKHNFFFKVSIGVRDVEMLNLLVSRGIVRRFYKLHVTKTNKLMYLIYPNYTKLNNTNLKLTPLARNKGHISMTLNALKIINIASGGSSFILKTTKGLLTHQEAIKAGLGGVVVCFIY
jgi:ribosomal protein S8